jgi:hypothetical protein
MFDGIPFPTHPGGDPIPTMPDPGNSPTQANFGYSTVPGLVQPLTTPVILQRDPYHEYSISKVVFDDAGVEVTPVGGPPGTPASVTRRCAPYGWMVIRWSSKRIGGIPLIPSRDLQDPNAVYDHGWKAFAAPGYFVDGTKCISIEGCYFYKLRLPYAETDAIAVGSAPYSSELVADTTIGGESYLRTILGPNLPPLGAPTDPITV